MFFLRFFFLRFSPEQQQQKNSTHPLLRVDRDRRDPAGARGLAVAAARAPPVVAGSVVGRVALEGLADRDPGGGGRGEDGGDGRGEEEEERGAGEKHCFFFLKRAAAFSDVEWLDFFRLGYEW